MTKARTYNNAHYGSAIFMILALLWLSVSAPFVFENQRQNIDNTKCSPQSPFAGMEEENANPAGNNTEEKVPKTSLNNLTEEYLDEDHRSDRIASVNLQYFKNQDAGIYVAYHGEPLVPPPNVA